MEGLAVPPRRVEHPDIDTKGAAGAAQGEKMTISLYDLTVPNYLQALGGASGFLRKGLEFCEKEATDPDEVVKSRLAGDMLPFSFQIASIAHHSAGAIEGIRQGEFRPPQDPGTWSYSDLQRVVEEAQEKLRNVSPEAVNGCAGKDIVFHLGKHQLPFTVENFLLSFSFPNFYFHVTTAYDLLRLRGVPLGKVDYLGHMRMKM